MKCIGCDCQEFELKVMRFEPQIKGKKIEVFAQSFVCIKCQTLLMDTVQMNVFRAKAADSYRKQHNLLTSQEIIKYRTSLKMSQDAFAKYLKIGIASIKRWEINGIQDSSHDDHIRLKCDLHHAKTNIISMEERLKC